MLSERIFTDWEQSTKKKIFFFSFPRNYFSNNEKKNDGREIFEKLSM